MNEGITPYIVVGVDGSAGADAALNFALAEAQLRGLPLRIVCAWHTPASAYIGEAFMATADGPLEAESHADTVLHSTITRLAPDPAIRIEALSIEGHAATVLTEQAQDAELLIVGSRGRNAATSLILGSVSQTLTHHTPCPLVIVPHPHPESPNGTT
jgi:nucleotide-binding universal stress UspA family protein